MKEPPNDKQIDDQWINILKSTKFVVNHVSK